MKICRSVISVSQNKEESYKNILLKFGLDYCQSVTETPPLSEHQENAYAADYFVTATG
jgi:hypothetical protein